MILDDDNDGILDIDDNNPKVFDTLKINTLPISIDHKSQTYQKALISNKSNTTSYTSNTINGLSINSNALFNRFTYQFKVAREPKYSNYKSKC